MVYFTSDVHLGGGGPEVARRVERQFVAWLDAVAADAETVVLLGDIFDFWFEYREVVRGHAVVKQVFDLGKEGVVAGCLVNDGFITTKGQIRVMRNGKLLHTGGIGTIRHFKESVEEVKMAQECGIMLDSFKTFQEGDVLECFAFEELPKSL